MSGVAAPEVPSIAPLTAEQAIAVLHVVAPCEVGGLERVVQALAIGHRRAGHRVSVVAVLGDRDAGHPFLGPLRTAGVEVLPLHLPRRGYLRERAVVTEICRRLQPQVVHTHGYHVDVVDAGAARGLGIPTVTTVHGFTAGDWKNRLYERLQRRAFRRFAAVVAVSRPLAGELASAGVPVERLHVVPNAWSPGDPPLPREAARRMLAVPGDRFHIGWVGRLSPEKGADVLLAALGRLNDLPCVISIVGDGRSRAQLELLAARLGLAARVRWCGNLPDAARLFPAFDVFVLSSRTEGTPIVLFEAMAAGTPIVATAVGGVADVVSAQAALLVPGNDPRALADAIRGTYVDRAGAAARARRARACLAEQFALAPWLAQYERVYRSVQ